MIPVFGSNFTRVRSAVEIKEIVHQPWRWRQNRAQGVSPAVRLLWTPEFRQGNAVKNEFRTIAAFSLT
jgi:hypothetical protein